MTREELKRYFQTLNKDIDNLIARCWNCGPEKKFLPYKPIDCSEYSSESIQFFCRECGYVEEFIIYYPTLHKIKEEIRKENGDSSSK